ncbi:nitroreductase family protein [Candidatus Pacearchaeota archaeon]|nr:nitroreductase family protein [Candidatus Pacearchaeota archaeon]
MKTEEAIKKRRSIRKFSNKIVKFGTILEIIDAANQAPFAGNINNLKYIIIESLENKKYIGTFSQQHWTNEASWIILICSELKKLEALYDLRASKYSKQQAGAAIQNMLLKTTDLGLSACWVGAFADEEIKSHFKIPQNWSIEAIIPIGYAKNKEKKSVRKAPLESKIFWEKWDEKYKPRKYPFKEPITK